MVKIKTLSPYAWTKTKNIELIKNYSKWFGLKYELLFFYNVYGNGQIIMVQWLLSLVYLRLNIKKKTIDDC